MTKYIVRFNSGENIIEDRLTADSADFENNLVVFWLNQKLVKAYSVFNLIYFGLNNKEL